MSFLDYTPSHVAPEQLEAITVGAHHRAVIGALIASVRDALGKPTAPHSLLVGPRGSGKSHALALFVHALRTDAALTKGALPLWLPEEEPYPRYADLFVEALERLSVELPSLKGVPEGLPALLRRTGESLRREDDDGRALDLAFATLEDAGRRLARRLVVVTENLQVTLDAPEGGGRSAWRPEWRLRALLQKARSVQLVGAAATLFGAVLDPDAPFYQFFAQHTLSELSPDEVVELFDRRVAWEAEHSKDPSRQRRAQLLRAERVKTEARLRGLVTLTGGLPRMAQQLFELLMRPDTRTLEEDLRRFLDRQTPYFQGRLLSGAVPAAELRVLDAIVDADGPVTSSALARTMGEDPRKVAVYLKRLQHAALVRARPSAAGTRGERWDVSEPLYRVWRRFRRGRDSRLQLVLLAEFVAALVPARELVADRAALLGAGVGRHELALLDLAIERHPALQGPRMAVLDRRGAAARRPDEHDLRKAWKTALEVYPRESLPALKARFAELASQTPEGGALQVVALALLSKVCQLSGELDEAMETCVRGERLASEMGSPALRAVCLVCLGDTLRRLGRLGDALTVLEDAEELSRTPGVEPMRGVCLSTRAWVLLQSGHADAALAVFSEAEALLEATGGARSSTDCVRGRGEALLLLSRFDEALSTIDSADARYRQSGEMLGRALCLLLRGKILFALGRATEVLTALSESSTICQAAGLGLGLAQCAVLRGHALLQLGRPSDALASFEQADSLYQALGEIADRANAARGLLSLALLGVTDRSSLRCLEDASAGHAAGGVADQAVDWIACSIALALTRGATLPEAVLDGWVRHAAAHESGAHTHDAFVSGATRLLAHVPDRRATLARIRERATPTLAALLRPLDLALAVQSGDLPDDLPDEPEEVRRAVRAALAALPPSSPREARPRRRRASP